MSALLLSREKVQVRLIPYPIFNIDVHIQHIGMYPTYSVMVYLPNLFAIVGLKPVRRMNMYCH